MPPWGWKIHLVFALQFFARRHGISSCREHRQLSRAPPVVRGTYSYRKNLQLSGLPAAVKSIFSCREHLQLSKVPPTVESTSTCPQYLQLRTPSVVESTSSCPKYLQLSRTPVVMYYTSAHSSLKSDLKFRTLLLPSVGSIFSQSKNGKLYIFQKMVSIKWFLNQKMENYILEKNFWKHTQWLHFEQRASSAAQRAKRSEQGMDDALSCCGGFWWESET